MLAVTNTSAFSSLPLVAPPVNIDLTIDLVNSNITGSKVINSTITTALRTLLLSVLANSNVNTLAKTRIAKYAGFYLNNATSPAVLFLGDKTPQPSNSEWTALIDKLTFYVMFRLPYTSDKLTYDEIGNGNIINEIVGIPNTWGRYANHIRTLSGAGLKKLNSAGEQVNNDGKPVNDSNVVLEGWHSEAAYNYLGETPFSANVTVPQGHPSKETEKAMLFGQNNEQPNAPGEVPLEITKIPLYFYLLAKVENPYSNIFWLNQNKDSLSISRVPHWPADILEKKYRKHFTTISSNTGNATVANGTYNLSNDTSGTYFNVGTNKVYITAKDSASLTFENLTLNTANKVEKTNEGLLAIWETKYENPTFKDAPGSPFENVSGLTVGMGVDIGAGFNGYFRIELTITITGTGSFRLYSAGRRSKELQNDISISEMKSTIENLLEIEDNESNKNIVKVKKTGNTFSVEITRKASKSNNKYKGYFAYNHRIFVSDKSNNLDVQIEPTNENDRWKINSNVLNDDLYFYNQLLNYSFSNTPSEDEYWLSQIGAITNNEKDKLKQTIKKLFGCQARAGYHIWDENKELIKKIEIKSYVRNLRATYHKIFLERFFNDKRRLKNNTQVNNTAKIDSFLKSLKVIPSQAELFAIVLLAYNNPSLFNKRKSKLQEAINQHSIVKLMNTIKGQSSDRITALNNFIGSTVKSKLYHGLED